MHPSTTPIETAIALLREGRAVEAEELLLREVRAAEAAHGPGSPAWASAQCDLGNVLLESHQLDRALECFRLAASAPAPHDPAAHKDHLTYRLNLAMALQMSGKLDEAEAEFRAGLQGRIEFYGREHAGFAFGLEPMADLLLERGNLAEARRAIEDAVTIYWNNGHERIASALALRAEIVKASGGDELTFPHLAQLPDQIVEQVAAAVTIRTGRAPTPAGLDVLRDLIAAIERRLGPDHQVTLNALSTLANVARDAGDTGPARAEAIRKVIASYDRQGRGHSEEALMATLGLAVAQSDGGDLPGALRTYADALERADRIGHPALRSQVLRNWGLALSEAGHPVEAERRLAEAVAAARAGTSADMLGRALVALGLFLQHAERLAEARSVVEEGLAVMSPADPDAVVGRSHLNAIIAGQSCGCGDMSDALAEAFRQFVIGRLPPNLLERFDVKVVDNDFNIEVALRREPSQDEMEHMDRVIKSALAEFRHQISQTR